VRAEQRPQTSVLLWENSQVDTKTPDFTRTVLQNLHSVQYAKFHAAF